MTPVGDITCPILRPWDLARRAAAVPVLMATALIFTGCGADTGDAPEDAGVEAVAPDAPRGASGVVLEPREPRGVPPTADTVDTLPVAPSMEPEESAPTELPARERPEIPLATDTLGFQIDTLRGVVGVTGTGTVPTAVLLPEGEEEVGLTGVLAQQLRSLAGGTVKVWGRRAASPVGPGMEVMDYRLLEIEGREPRVGVLEAGASGDWILRERSTDEELVLMGMPSTGIQTGMLVWVVGTEDARGRVAVEFHGVIQLDPR